MATTDEVEAAGAEAADVAGQGVGRVDKLVEDAQGAQHLGDAVEADVGVARLDLAQGVTGDARSLGDLLRSQAEHHAPSAHMLSELRHLTLDPVARHAPPFTMTTIVARTEVCGDVARRMVQ